MNPLVIEIALAIVAAFLAGLGIGWLVLGTVKKPAEEASRDELAIVRKRHTEAEHKVGELQQALRYVEDKNRKTLLYQATTLDNDDFHRVRTELEEARKQLDITGAELKRREQQVMKLIDISKTLKKQLELRQKATLKLASNTITPLPGSIKMEDDLLALEDMTPEIAHKLRSLGIINYRQLAEFSPPQLQNIQTLIGTDSLSPLPLTRWTTAAHLLFHIKYAHLFPEN